MYLTGAVNGFIPLMDAVDDAHTIDHKKTALERDRRLFEDVASCARETFTASCFAQDSLDNAEALPMDVSRIYVKDGVRMARIAPSEFLR